jgi:hypothetical protein
MILKAFSKGLQTTVQAHIDSLKTSIEDFLVSQLNKYSVCIKFDISFSIGQTIIHPVGQILLIIFNSSSTLIKSSFISFLSFKNGKKSFLKSL